ncbi:MAG: hypothetical protein IID61_02895 [SAR324 cluster bacterium]|nr:hypothetical protein [SAR324 cluster bacterium]
MTNPRTNFDTRLREERQFPSVDALKAQIAEDCRQARDFLEGLDT